MPVLNFFARSGPKIEKIDSLASGRGGCILFATAVTRG
jgi:hypothetical protein